MNIPISGVIAVFVAACLLGPTSAAPAGADTASMLTTLHSFSGGSDGAGPYRGVIAGRSGALYGTTFAGGNTSCPLSVDYEDGCGTVFKLTPP
jgi:hypothetical protein